MSCCSKTWRDHLENLEFTRVGVIIRDVSRRSSKPVGAGVLSQVLEWGFGVCSGEGKGAWRVGGSVWRTQRRLQQRLLEGRLTRGDTEEFRDTLWGTFPVLDRCKNGGRTLSPQLSISCWGVHFSLFYLLFPLILTRYLVSSDLDISRFEHPVL